MSSHLVLPTADDVLAGEAAKAFAALGASWSAAPELPGRHELRFTGSERVLLVSASALRVISLIDGACSLGEVQHRMRETYGCTVAMPELENLYEMLCRNGLARRVSRPAPGRLMLQGGAADKAMTTINIAPLVEWIHEKRHLLFGPVSLLLLAVAVLYGVYAYVVGMPFAAMKQLQESGLSLHLHVLLLAPLVLILLIGAHELAHACMLRRLGARTAGMKIQWRYGWLPLVFTDTTGLVQVEGRYQKMLVFLAGPLSDLFFVGALSWMLGRCESGSATAVLLSALLATMGIAVSFNLNPFVRDSDGYRVASHISGVADLHSASLQALRNAVSKASAARGITADHLTPSRRRALLTWRVLSISVNTALLTLILGWVLL